MLKIVKNVRLLSVFLSISIFRRRKKVAVILCYLNFKINYDRLYIKELNNRYLTKCKLFMYVIKN